MLFCAVLKNDSNFAVFLGVPNRMDKLEKLKRKLESGRTLKDMVSHQGFMANKARTPEEIAEYQKNYYQRMKNDPERNRIKNDQRKEAYRRKKEESLK